MVGQNARRCIRTGVQGYDIALVPYELKACGG